MRKTVRPDTALRFTRWSRKGYAMFCSLGRCVTIGHVRKSIADCSLRKQKNALALVEAFCQCHRATAEMAVDTSSISVGTSPGTPPAALAALLPEQCVMYAQVPSVHLFIYKRYTDFANVCRQFLKDEATTSAKSVFFKDKKYDCK